MLGDANTHVYLNPTIVKQSNAGRRAVLAIAAGVALSCSESTAPPKPASVSPSVSNAVDATAGLPLTTSPTFAVTDASGNTLGGITVTVAVTAGGGTLPDAPTKTVKGGPTPIGTWTLGKTAGLNTVTVTVGTLPAAVININGKAGPPAAIVFVQGSGETGLAGAVLALPAIAQVRDQFANAVAGATVLFTVGDGGGTVSGTPVVTDASGNASAPSWHLGKSAVPQSLRASSAGITAILNANIQSDYDVDLRFYGPPMPPAAAAAFTAAAARIKGSIIGDVQDIPVTAPVDLEQNCGVTGVTLPIGTVDDVIIYAAVAPIDGPNKILAFSGPCFIRTSNALTVIGVMQFDSNDIDNLIASGRMQDVIQHEMLHVVGIGTLWTTKNLLAGARTADSRFTGALGIGACLGLGGTPVCTGGVQVENTGGAGTADSHWRESSFGNELMTGFVNSGANLYSVISIQSLADLGYSVNASAADDYGIPGLSLSVQQTRASLLAEMSPQWESVSPPRFLISRSGQISRAEKQ